MIARGFKPMGWVAAVAAAALGCYMLSLNVAAERAELAGIERQIIAAKQDIRALQTELGTRGRLAQLEQWNAEVLALSAPGSKQFVTDEFRLASLLRPQQTVDPAKVRMASADAAGQPSAKPAIVFEPPAAEEPKPLLRRASLLVTDEPSAALVKAAARPEPRKQAPAPRPAKPVPAKKSPVASTALIDEGVLEDISTAAKAEKKGGGAGGQ